MRLTGCRILICEDGVARFPEGFGWVCGVLFDSVIALSVDCGNDVEEVLKFIVVNFGGCHCFVERVEKGWVVRAEGEFGYHVGEVEF